MRKCISTGGAILIFSLHTLALVAQNTANVQQQIGELEKKAATFLQQQKPELAVPLLREITSLDPKNVNAQANLGVLLFFEGKYTEAIPHMRIAAQLQPELWRIQALLGIAEKRTGDLVAARADLERAFANLDDKKIQIQAGLELIELDSAASQFDKALSIATRLQEISPQDPQVLLAAYQLARQMMAQSLLSVIVTAPESAEAHMMMAGELGRQGDHAAAVAQYHEAIRLKPTLPGVHYELAEQLRISPDPAFNAQAESEYKAAIQQNQYDELSWRQLGGITAAKGDFKAAAEDYNKALALQPNDSDAKTGLAIALISTDQTGRAISLLESALKDDPSNIVAHFRLSSLYRRAGRTAEADRELEAFHHYQDVKEKLGKVFKDMAGPSNLK